MLLKKIQDKFKINLEFRELKASLTKYNCLLVRPHRPLRCRFFVADYIADKTDYEPFLAVVELKVKTRKIEARLFI